MIMNDNSLLIRFSLDIKVGLFTMVLNFGMKETRRQMDKLNTDCIDHPEHAFQTRSTRLDLQSQLSIVLELITF